MVSYMPGVGVGAGRYSLDFGHFGHKQGIVLHSRLGSEMFFSLQKATFHLYQKLFINYVRTTAPPATVIVRIYNFFVHL